jgi:hypothetical protein
MRKGYCCNVVVDMGKNGARHYIFYFYANLQYLLCPFALMQKNEKIKAAKK